MRIITKRNFTENQYKKLTDTAKLVPVDKAVATTVPDSLIPCMKLATIIKFNPSINKRKIPLGTNESPKHV